MKLLLIVAAILQDGYVVDKDASVFTAKVEVGGLLSTFGHDHTVAMRDLSGEARFDPEKVEGSLRMTIRAGSIVEAGQEFSEKDREAITKEIHEKALEVSKHPEIVFQSQSVSGRKVGEGEYQVLIRGRLTLHGMTREVSIPARLRLEDRVLTARGSFTVRHSDFGIERLSAAAGTVKAKDEITLTFHIVGRRS
jgi:polyisoprenoid-binding protein YceI